jgi:hypothetical protein
MATLAAILDRLALREADGLSSHVQTREPDSDRIRAFANEDVFFFTKRIDNSRIVRQQDPSAGRVCWGMIGASMAGAVAIVAVMLPALYSAFAGYKLEELREERARLTHDHVLLELQEAKFLNPRHLQELADKQSFVDPDPRKIVYLDSKPDGVEAKRFTLPSKDVSR